MANGMAITLAKCSGKKMDSIEQMLLCFGFHGNRLNLSFQFLRSSTREALFFIDYEGIGANARLDHE